MDASQDVGFAYTQTVANSSEVIFQSSPGEVTRSDFDLLGKQEDKLNIKTKEGSWTFEKNAMGSRRQDSDWAFSPMHLAAVLLGISETISRQTNSIDVNLTTGLPYKSWKNADFRKRYKKRLTGLHEIYRDKKRQEVNIKSIQVIPQNLGAIFFHFLDNKGAFKSASKKSFIVGSINIGGHTVEMATAEFILNDGDGGFSLNIEDSQCSSKPLGMYIVLNSLQESLDTEYPGEVWRDHELFDILKSNHLSLYGEKHNVSHLTMPIKDNYQSNRITGLITTNWSEQSKIQISRLDGLVSSGGGALVMDHNRLKKHHPNILVSQRPQWDTVIGYGKLFKLLQKSKQ